jgi:hypothetical protein
LKAWRCAHYLLPLLAVTAAFAGDLPDGISLTLASGPSPGDVTLSWTAGPGGPFTVYRSTSGPPNAGAANSLATTSLQAWTDTPPAGAIFFYKVTAHPFWNDDISTAPLDSQSSTIISNLAAAGGFGGTGKLVIDFSMNVLTADATVPFQSFNPTGSFILPDCDLTTVPVPPGGAVEGESGYSCTPGGVCNLLVLHQPTSKLYEMDGADITGGVFSGGCLAVWDLNRVYPPSDRGEQCVSASAAGLPIVPLLFTADDLQAGAITHAIRFQLPGARIQRGVYVHPATGAAGSTGTGMPPMGARFRLRADYPLASIPDEGSRIIARAMQRFGMILTDVDNLALAGANDRFTAAKWSTVLPNGPVGLGGIRVTDFEMIDGGTRLPFTFDCSRNP